MKTIKELLKYGVNKKVVVFSVVLLLINITILMTVKFHHLYEYIFLMSFDWQSLRYVFVVTND